MAHRIFGERFISRSEPAWHKLGLIFPEGEVMTASEAVARVAGDVQVVSMPLFYEAEDGTKRPVDGSRAIVRKATTDAGECVFGITGDNWFPASYVDLAGSLDELSKTYRVETAGALRNGGLVFLSFRADNWEVTGGDEYRMYFLANFSLTPGRGHSFSATPVRTVCDNTNTLALSSATISLRIPHLMDAKQRIGLAGSLVAQFKKVQEQAKATFDSWTKIPVHAEQLKELFAAAWPQPQMPPRLRMVTGAFGGDEAAKEIFKAGLDEKVLAGLTREDGIYQAAVSRTMLMREAGQERFESFDPPQYRGSLYAAYNAVTEVADWREGKGADRAVLFGDRAREKARAFTAALQIAQN